MMADGKVLTTGSVGDDKYAALMAKLGLRAMTAEEPMRKEKTCC